MNMSDRPTPGGGEPPTRWDVVIAAVAAGIFVSFQIGKAPAALPVLRSELDLSLVTSGWLISMFHMIGIVTGMAAGAIADRVGHRRMLLLGMLVTALASALGAAADGAATILISRFFEGFGFIMSAVAAPGLIARAARPVHHKLAFGMWGCYMPTGTAVMILLAPAIMEFSGWRGLWLVNALLLLAFALWLARVTRDFVAPPPRSGTAVPPLQAMGLTLSAPAPWLLALCFGCYTGQFLAVLGFLPVMLVEDQGMGTTAAAVLVALAVATNAPGNLIGGVLLHRGWPRWLLIALASTGMGLSTLGIYSDALPDAARYLLVLLFSLTAGLLPTSVLGAAPVFAPKPVLVGTTTGLIMQGSNLGQTIGPPAVAALVSASGSWSSAPFVLVAAAVLAFALSLAIREQERRITR